ncbi:phytoene desaturase family protein [Candidatus Izemoplasma sp. B36]|uniref:phytoene desaturase family protein n=1 Tax=Candidatus Izemoplasma sp. B36 TaxID=3242468 RepID=UPI0035583420
MRNNREKVIIVGAGMAGLTAAAYLSRENYDVTILEKREKVGGLVGTIERDGFFFDTGPRAFVNSGMVLPILRDLDIDMEIVNNKIKIGIENQSFNVKSLDSLEDYREMLVNLYPKDIREIDIIIKYIKKLSKYTAVLYKFDNPYFVDYVSDKKILFTKLLPWAFKLMYSLRQFNKYDQPMEQFLAKITSNDSLIDIITQYFFKKTPTYFALGYFFVYMDYFYPKKGTQSLPKLLLNKNIENNVDINYNININKVLPSKNTVYDSEGNSYQYDHLIWAADLKTFYKNIDDYGLSNKQVKNVNNQKDKVLASKAAESSFIVYLGVDIPPSYFKSISGEHMFFTPSRQGLHNINREKKEELKNNIDSKSKEEIIDWIRNFLDLNSFEVSIPSLRDLSLSPKDKTGVMISFLFDYELAKRINEKGLIKKVKEVIEEKIIELFSNSLFPGLSEKVIFKFSSSPVDINNIVGSSEGGIVGWSFEAKPPVYNKLKDMPKSAKTPISNIYQAGQWAYAPAGVPIAMLTGWHAFQGIMKAKKK